MFLCQIMDTEVPKNSSFRGSMTSVPSSTSFINQIIQTPESAELSPKEKAMLLFVLKAVGDPESVDEIHMNTAG